MKKAVSIFAALLSIILLVANVFAEEIPSFSGMSNKELIAWIKSGLQEIANREADSYELVYEDKEQGIKLSYIGVEYQEYFSSGKHVDRIRLNAMLLNASQKKVTATIDNVYVNN